MESETEKLMTPEQQAWNDWRQEGAFFTSQLDADARHRYVAEAQRIEFEHEEAA